MKTSNLSFQRIQICETANILLLSSDTQGAAQTEIFRLSTIAFYMYMC